MSCSKEEYVKVKDSQDVGVIRDLCNIVMKDKLFGFLQVDVHVPDELLEKFSEFSPLFLIDSVPEDQIPEHMKVYPERTQRKIIGGTKKLLGVTRVKEIWLYMLMLKWYLNHDLKATTIHKYLKYESVKFFSWFPEEVSQARQGSDNNPALKQLRDIDNLEGNLFYGKMIEDLMKHLRMIFTTNESLVDQSSRPPSFEDLEEIHGAFEIRECKRRVNITLPCQCSNTVYKLAELRMLEFYYNFPDKYLDQRDFELIQIDTDSMYMATSGNSVYEIVRPELRKEYDNGGKAEFLSASKYHDRTLGLFKAEPQGTRIIALMSKCYYAEDAKLKPKFSCKGISRKQNPMSWERYLESLKRSINKAQNTGFRILGKGIVTYTKEKFGHSAYYDKHIIATNGIHTEPLS